MIKCFGGLVGPDESCLDDRFAAYVRAKQEVHRIVLGRLEQCDASEDIFGPV